MVESTKNTTEIEITPEEQKLFDTLLKVAADNNLKTTMRVAGGWVRDKVSGQESNDIDI